MFKDYIEMKKNEWKIKLMFYKTIASIMESQSEIKSYIELIKKLLDELKEVPVEDLKSEFIGKLAGIIHAENQRQRNI